ncbi:replication protein C, IncQ-type [Azospirillum sp. TSO5]|uniref:replication protein C, IncQ-type n=1 Tax=Azospirillum sp. TSO5 TaxID=716760 RepID=UPI000D620E4C|nr:replication protein C, IncQ-type [Azospirillum sp. TSO5]PWC92937.1 hypothetical protein TSO5_16040 [Azospirillum sp. TSO5]
MPIFTVQPRGRKAAEAWDRNEGRFERTDWLPVHNDTRFDEGNVEIRLSYPVWLSEMHESVLLGCLVLAGRIPPARREFSPRVVPLATVSRSDERSASGRRDDRIVISTTAYALLEASGLAITGPNYKSLPEVLEDLFQIRYVYRGGSEERGGGTELFNFEVEAGGRLRIWLSERLSRIFYTDAVPQIARFVSIDMAERSRLKGEMARLLHRYLSVVVWQGEKARPFYPDTLLAQVYRDPPEDRKAKFRRREGLCKALEQIAALDGWEIEMDSGRNDARFLVTRHRNRFADQSEDVPAGEGGDA